MSCLDEVRRSARANGVQAVAKPFSPASSTVIEHIEHELSREIVSQWLDQPTDLHRYTAAQGDRLKLDVYPSVRSFEPLHHNRTPDVSRPSSLHKRMLTGLAIIGDLLHAYSGARDQHPVGGPASQS